jgi:hypothetical protein
MSNYFRSLLLVNCLAIFMLSGLACADDVRLASGSVLKGQVLNLRCPECAASGQKKCPLCHGRGLVGDKSCPGCKGRGKSLCAKCQGLGVVGKKIRMRIRSGIITLDRADVKEIKWEKIDIDKLRPAKVVYRERIANLDIKDAQAHFKLGSWCVERGLTSEARKHLEVAVKLEANKYAPLIRPLLERLARSEEQEAVKALLDALAVYTTKGAMAGAQALKNVKISYPASEIIKRSELQRDLIKKRFPALANADTDTLAALIASAADILAASCAKCQGGGKVVCPECDGKGAGRCAVCAGGGRRSCPVCKGKQKLTCRACFGSGVAGRMGARKILCRVCGGTGEVSCDVCRGSGNLPCTFCAGKGVTAKTCLFCQGSGHTLCDQCRGSGVRQIKKLLWGPAPIRQAGAVSVGDAGPRSKAWQGRLGGAVITVVPARVLWRGALGRNVEAVVGEGLVVVAICLDNRNGQEMIRFRPARATLRGVDSRAQQAEICRLDEKLEAGANKDPRLKMLARFAGNSDCLPGAGVSLLAAFPAKTRLADLSNLFWVRSSGQIIKLAPIWLTAQEVLKLRKTLQAPATEKTGSKTKPGS